MPILCLCTTIVGVGVSGLLFVLGVLWGFGLLRLGMCTVRSQDLHCGGLPIFGSCISCLENYPYLADSVFNYDSYRNQCFHLYCCKCCRDYLHFCFCSIEILWTLLIILKGFSCFLYVKVHRIICSYFVPFI